METHGANTRELYYSADGQVLTEWYDGLEQARNVWSPVAANTLVLRDQARQDNGVLNDRFYVQQDANGNVTALVNAVSSYVVERYAYSPYGSYNVPYGFQGLRADATVGLDFADNRVDDRTLMRWLQTDPLGLNAGTNDYEFVGDGPMDRVDPSGLTWNDLFNLFRYPRETAAGMAAGLTNLKEGAKTFGAQAMYTVVDTSALMGQKMLSKVGIERAYAPRSSLYQGLAITLKPGAYLQQAGGQMVRSGVTLGGADILDAIREFEQTGDATKASQKLGGVAAGNLTAAAAGKLTQPSRQPCAQPGAVLTPTTKGARQTFATGQEWYQYYAQRYGARNVEWVSGSGRTITWPSQLPLPANIVMVRVRPPPCPIVHIHLGA